MTGVMEHVIDQQPVRVRDGEALIPFRVPWYRSLPLSSLEQLDLTVDGKEVPPEKLRVEINNGSYTLAELAEHSYEFWFVQDTGYVPVQLQSLGGTVWVRARATFRIPYIALAPGKYMRRTIIDEARLTIEKDK